MMDAGNDAIIDDTDMREFVSARWRIPPRRDQIPDDMVSTTITLTWLLQRADRIDQKQRYSYGGLHYQHGPVGWRGKEGKEAQDL